MAEVIIREARLAYQSKTASSKRKINSPSSKKPSVLTVLAPKRSPMATSKIKSLTSVATNVRKKAKTTTNWANFTKHKSLMPFLGASPSSTVQNLMKKKLSKSTKPAPDGKRIQSILQTNSDDDPDADDLSTPKLHETCALLNSSSPSLHRNNDEEHSKALLNNPWVPNLPGNIMMRKFVTRDKKQRWVHNNGQENFLNKLVKTCAQTLGTVTAVGVFDKIGRVTGMKEGNALIEVCIMEANSRDSEEESQNKFLKEAYKIYKSMKEQGFAVNEDSYGPLLLFLAEKGMVQEFHFFCDVVGEDSSTISRLGYYEMLLWIRVGDEKKIHELCDDVIGDVEDKSDLLVNYLLALCESDWMPELLQLLDLVDITKVSSSAATICKSLGRLSLDSTAEKFLFAFKTHDPGAKDIGSCIFNYIASVPNLEVEDAILKFKNLHMKLDLTPSSASYQMLITYCCQFSKVHPALDLVDEMREAGLPLALEMMHTILNASMESCNFNLVHPIYSIICQEDYLKPGKETFRLLIMLSVRMKDFEGAYGMLENLKERNLNPTTSMYNSIMGGYFREKNFQGAMMVFKQMELANVTPDSVTFSYLIQNCDCEKDIIKYYEELKTSDIQITKHVYMALINAYANCGQFEKAKQVVLDRKSDTFLNEVKSALVSALTRHGQVSDAFEIYKEIKQANLNLDPRAAITVIDHLQHDGELSRLLQLLNEFDDRDFWVEACWRIILYCVRYKHLSTSVDLLRQLKDSYSNDEMALEVLFDEAFSLIGEMGSTHLQFGLELLKVIKAKLGMLPSRKCLDFLLSACVEAKDLKSSFLIWKEYQKADLPYNVLSYIRMYQAYLASGDKKSANLLLSKIPKVDHHVCYFIEACQSTYISKTKKKVKKKLNAK